MVAVLGLLVMLTPLPLGSHRDWGWAAIALAASLLALLMGVLAFAPVAQERQLAHRSAGLRLGVLCLLSLPVWAMVQTSNLVPASWFHPAWFISFGGANGIPPDAAISVAPDMSANSAVRLLSYLTIGVGAWAAAVYRASFGLHLLRVVAVAGVFYGAYGLLELAARQHFAVHPAVMPYPTDLSSANGPFVNRNHFATFVGMGLVCLVALWRHHMVARGLRMPTTIRRALRDSIERFLGQESVYLIGCAVMFCALLLSGSRAGVATTLIGVALLLVLMRAFGRSSSKPVIIPWVTGMSVASGLLMLAGYPLLTRLLATPAVLGFRKSLMDIGLQAIEDRPFLGHGVGAFEQTYFLYASTEYALFQVDYMHNEFLELAAGAGLPVALVTILGFVLLGRKLLAGTARKAGTVLPACGLAVMAQVGLHSVFDFSVSVPAVALTFSVVLGVALAGATTKIRT
ncbi:O-antigen ligase family protein [Candidatus Phaeomarinobacter ectocarpi]|nr:O-antigen ligase family protein [Candidatus Phaeomarinobacter ectocarpi]